MMLVALIPLLAFHGVSSKSLKSKCTWEKTPSSTPTMENVPFLSMAEESADKFKAHVEACLAMYPQCCYVLYQRSSGEFLYFGEDISNDDLADKEDVDLYEILCGANAIIPPSFRRAAKKRASKERSRKKPQADHSPAEEEHRRNMEAALIEQLGEKEAKEYFRLVRKVKKAMNRQMGIEEPLEDGLLFGDELLSKEQLLELLLSLTGSSRRRRSAPTVMARRIWPSTNIKFKFRDITDESYRNRIRNALKEIEKVSCLQFQETTESTGDRIEFVSGGGCAAQVGHNFNPPNLIWLSSSCGTFNIVHEVFHALGIAHEQSRGDRNQFVKINLDNIQSGREYNFALSTDSDIESTAYDYNSVMHYPDWAFSKNGQNTIEAIGSSEQENKHNQNRMGQRNHISPADQQAINHHMCSSNPSTTSPGEPARVRLMANGVESTERGRVEVYKDGQWGSVCDDAWDQNDAKVVCRMLGHQHLQKVSANSNARFGQGSGQIMLDDVQCAGSESNIEACRHNGWRQHNCGHHEDAGVECVLAEEFQIRLLDNGQASTSKGVVEVFWEGQWGLVCDDAWGQEDARVVCRMLGNQDVSTARATLRSVHGTGNNKQKFWMDEVNCTGSETSLIECGRNTWGQHDCTPATEKAGVVCHYTIQDARLVGGQSEREGRLEVKIGDEWGTVCDDFFNVNAARTACRMLQFQSTNAQTMSFGAGSGKILLDDVRCSADDSHLNQCSFLPESSHNCQHSEDVGVRCL